MEKLLQETFADLRLTARQQSVFEEVYVERLCLLREQKRVEVHIVSEHIIPYREIALLEYALNQLFDKAGFTVQVTDRFRLSEQYTPENFWQEYQDKCRASGNIPMGYTKYCQGYSEYTIVNKLTNHLEH